MIDQNLRKILAEDIFKSNLSSSPVVRTIFKKNKPKTYVVFENRIWTIELFSDFMDKFTNKVGYKPFLYNSKYDNIRFKLLDSRILKYNNLGTICEGLYYETFMDEFQRSYEEDKEFMFENI